MEARGHLRITIRWHFSRRLRATTMLGGNRCYGAPDLQSEDPLPRIGSHEAAGGDHRGWHEKCADHTKGNVRVQPRFKVVESTDKKTRNANTCAHSQEDQPSGRVEHSLAAIGMERKQQNGQQNADRNVKQNRIPKVMVAREKRTNKRRLLRGQQAAQAPTFHAASLHSRARSTPLQNGPDGCTSGRECLGCLRWRDKYLSRRAYIEWPKRE